MASNFPVTIQVPITQKMADKVEVLKKRTGFGMPYILRPMLEKGLDELLSETEGMGDE